MNIYKCQPGWNYIFTVMQVKVICLCDYSTRIVSLNNFSFSIGVIFATDEIVEGKEFKIGGLGDFSYIVTKLW